jgi:hypothetical protein
MKTLISLSPTKAVYEFSHNGNKRIISLENKENEIVDFERISSEKYSRWISWIFVEPTPELEETEEEGETEEPETPEDKPLES